MKVIHLNLITHFRLKHCRIVHDIFCFQVLTFLNHRTDHITLSSLCNLFSHKLICSLAISVVHHAVLDRQTVRRQFIDYGNIQITKTCSIAPYDVSNMTAALLNVCEDQQEAEHHHPYEQINTYLAGRTVMSVEGQSEVCGPGWICVIPPDVPHEGTLVEPTLQVNFSSPARGAGYVEFLRNAFKTDQ